MIEGIYKKLDDQIMKGANICVRSYNWTTGKTKADLANKLLTLAPIAEVTGLILYSYSNPILIPFNIFLSGVLIYYSHYLQKYNQETDNLEQKALEEGCLDFRVQLRKRDHAVFGPLWLMIGSMQGTLEVMKKENKDYSGYIIMFGHLIRGASDYVMRADYLPPRKSAIKIGLEKLAEIAENYKAPSIQPAPVPAG